MEAGRHRRKRVKRRKRLSAVGFEPTSANTVELESTPLDRSGTLTIDKVTLHHTKSNTNAPRQPSTTNKQNTHSTHHPNHASHTPDTQSHITPFANHHRQSFFSPSTNQLAINGQRPSSKRWLRVHAYSMSSGGRVQYASPRAAGRGLKHQ